MPNGRSGGFMMNATEWKVLAEVVAEQTMIGKICDGGAIRAVTLADVIRLIETSSRERLTVEEQHHDSYIVHINNEPQILWIVVGPESPIFPELQKLHARWMAEHPGWNGWIAL
ncbi:MAG: hypothetical protein ABSG69_09865 [Candidatus Acidiferrum sp.]|jgi:hypothetical protein